MNFSGGNRNSTQGHYGVRNINIILFLYENIYSNFNQTDENTGSENHHIVLHDKFECVKERLHENIAL